MWAAIYDKTRNLNYYAVEKLGNILGFAKDFVIDI